MWNLSGPVVIKKGHLHAVCFFEGDDKLLDFRPKTRFAGVRWLEKPAFYAGDIIETPRGAMRIKRMEVIPLFDLRQLENQLRRELIKKDIIFTNELLTGFRYEIEEVEGNE